ncbi:MAG: ImmA/IrrE family metallo-endopeptidase [Hyphomonas sp.]|nr:ImmA/IrrE family metallo-endopeptidase [Hyphomonas sp.]
MNKDWSPKRWANHLTRLLDAVYTDGRFPVDVKLVAEDFTKQLYPDRPINLIKGASLPGFEGALYPSPPGKPKGWGIIYNSDIQSSGRINFTLAHELGHYLVHRNKYPNGLECQQEDFLKWDSEYAQVESEANDFAASLLMPLNDFRSKIGASDKPTLADIGACAERYEVSLTAAILRWLQYTSRRAVLVVSRDGFIKWARSSDSALKSGLFFRTRNQPPIPIPRRSLAAQPPSPDGRNLEKQHGQDVWLNEPCCEFILASDRYDLVFSLLHFDEQVKDDGYGEDRSFDSYDQFVRNSR